MYRCFSDAFGNMPCDNGCICDKCSYMNVEIIRNDFYFNDCWNEDDLEEIEALNDILNVK